MNCEEKIYYGLFVLLIIIITEEDKKLSSDEWKEGDPRAENGQFGTGGTGQVTSQEEKQKKIDEVKIDFTKDNKLPELNVEDLKELGKESKQVILKKDTIERNNAKHHGMTEEDYEKIIGQSLYNSDLRFKGKKYEGENSNDAINFVSIGKIDGKSTKNGLTLIELSDKKENYEIVHVFKIRDKELNRMTKYKKS